MISVSLINIVGEFYIRNYNRLQNITNDSYLLILFKQNYFSLGGLIMLSQKHKNAKKIKYKSGVFITTNKRPKFGKKQSEDISDSSEDSDNDNNRTTDADHEAVYNRLECFKTKPLQKKDSSVSGELIFNFINNI